MDTADRWSVPLAGWLVSCLALAYVPDMGHGFISDDFSWILYSRIHAPRDVVALFTTAPMGFYRPLVSVSFVLNEPIAGLTPLAYGLVNLALALAVGAAIVALVEAMGLRRGHGLFAAAVWAFNIHGVGMALTWISGRTSLLATLFATLAGLAFVRDRRGRSAMWTLLALLSKEEPLLLPFAFLVWAVHASRQAGASLRTALAAGVRRTWPVGAALLAYLVLRAVSGAMTPWTAPPYYALTLAPSVVGTNLLEYVDRAATFGLALIALGILVFVRRVPRAPWFEACERAILVRGGVWAVCGYGVTVMVPVRSDLYACLPSVGVALIAAGAGRALWRHVPVSRHRAALVGALLLPVALLPVYRGRNVFARQDAMLSTAVVRRAVAALQDRDDLTRVEVYQQAGETPSIASALGGGLAAAIELGTGRRVSADIQLTAPADRWPAPASHTLRLTVVGDEIVAVAPPQ